MKMKSGLSYLQVLKDPKASPSIEIENYSLNALNNDNLNVGLRRWDDESSGH